jgi:hypothetical protein
MVMMIMCTINHCVAKIGVDAYEWKFFLAVSVFETVGQPNLRDVAHDVIVTTISARPIKAITLFFISDIFLFKREIKNFSTQS